MAPRRKKKRTQPLGQIQNAHAKGISKTDPADRVPKSMVIRMGASDVGPSVSQLVKDMRNVMEPHTASKLKERRSNRLRDYTTMAGPLGVSHFMLFSRSPAGNTSLRLAVSPRGPTLNFRVEKYSLCKDIVKSLKRPRASGGAGLEHLTPPLLVMNNFTTPNSTSTTPIPKHLESLTTSVFQSMFPPISPQQTPLKSIRRVLLLNREITKSADAEDQGSYVINLRHYAITTKPIVPLSRGLKRIRAAEQRIKPHPESKPSSTTKPNSNATHPPKSKSHSSAHVPNMSKLDDIADYILDPQAAGGYTSASETEVDTDAEVEVLEPQARHVTSRSRTTRRQQPNEPPVDPNEQATTSPPKPQRTHAATPVQRKAIKLTEIGPRLKLRLVKVEEGLCQGKVMWHEFVQKTAEQVKDLDALWEQRNAEKEQRRRIQRENLERKKKQVGSKGGAADADGDGDADDGDDVGDADDFDDDEWEEDMLDIGEEDLYPNGVDNEVEDEEE